MSRWVLVDDTDPGITFTGQWFEDQGTQNDLGNFGPPYLSTLHGTNSDASFSYSFNGTTVIITGTNQSTNPSGVTNPLWQCIVDGESVPSATVYVPENRLLFCEKSGLSDGPHVITVNVTVSNQQTFWFDYIQYLPSPSISLDHQSLSIDSDDSQFQYGTGWTPISPGNMTAQTGSTFSFEFTGISLIWLGFYLNNLPTASTTATYAIDGQSPTTFTLNGASSENTGVQYNQIFFQTNQLSYGSHNLDVVYQGNSETTPLTLSVLLVQNNASSGSRATSSGATAVSSAGSLPQSANSPVQSLTNGSGSSSGQTTSGFSTILSPSSTSLNATNRSSNLGPIIGGVIGGLALLIFAILAIFFLRQRSNRQRNNRLLNNWLQEEAEAAPIVSPFVNPSMTALSSLSHYSSSDNFHSDPQHTRDLSGYGTTINTNTTSAPPQLTPNGDFNPTRMLQVINVTPLSTQGLREQRKGERIISHAPQLRQESQAPSSIIGNNSQPTRFVQDEDAGIQLARTDQHGDFVEILPPVYSF